MMHSFCRDSGLLLLSLFCFCTVAAGRAPAGQKPLPEFSRIKATVERHFAACRDHRPGDLLSQSNIIPVFKQLHHLGWDAPDRKSIRGRILKDQDFLVRQLQSDSGRKFMNQVGKHPMAYDRLHRMTALPQGRRMVHDLIKGPDGGKMIEYLTSTSGGKNLGKMLGKAPKGVDFNKPTGRIYTVAQLIVALQKSHAKSRAQRAKANPPK